MNMTKTLEQAVSGTVVVCSFCEILLYGVNSFVATGNYPILLQIKLITDESLKQLL